VATHRWVDARCAMQPNSRQRPSTRRWWRRRSPADASKERRLSVRQRRRLRRRCGKCVRRRRCRRGRPTDGAAPLFIAAVAATPRLAEGDISEHLASPRVQPPPQPTAHPLTNAVWRSPRQGGAAGARKTDGESVCVRAAVIAPQHRASQASAVASSVSDAAVGVVGGALGPPGGRGPLALLRGEGGGMPRGTATHQARGEAATLHEPVPTQRLRPRSRGGGTGALARAVLR
jgi:hypothetical protein